MKLALEWYWESIKGKRAIYIFGLFLMLGSSVIIMINANISETIIQTCVYEGNVSILPLLLVILLGLYLVRLLVRFAGVYIWESTANWLVTKLRIDLYNKIQKQDMRFYTSNATGDLMAKMTGDLEAIRHFTSYVIGNTADGLLLFTAGIGLLFSKNWILTLIMLSVSPLIFWLTIRVSKAVRPLFSLRREEYSNLNSNCAENISANRVIKAFAREDFEIEKFSERNFAFRDINLLINKMRRTYSMPLNFFTQLMAVLTLLVGSIFVVQDQLTIGQLAVFTSFTWLVSQPFQLAINIANDTQNFFASVDKILPLFYAKPDIVNCEKPVNKEKIQGEIEFENVSLTINSTQILKDINLHIMPGETIGIMGPTGSGKTSLLNLIVRFYDTSKGELKIDGITVKNYDIKCLHKNIAVTTQDVFLFSDTIEGNIAYGNPDVPFEDVEACAREASAGFIKYTVDGFDTIIGERGIGLSGGQKQRIALARAFCYDTPILILDDTTSAVDMETEKEIQAAIKKRSSHSTTIVVAQRISSICNADKIFVIENGNITQFGTHKTLISEKGYYQEICKIQGIFGGE